MASFDSTQMRRILESTGKRIRQGTKALSKRHAECTLPDRYRRLLASEVVDRWHALSPYDQQHLLAVAEDLRCQGHGRHTVLAGLLHDIGKPANATIATRAIAVMIQRTDARPHEPIMRRLRSVPGLNQIHAFLDHPAAGADFLADHGVSPEVVWLVRHHDELRSHPHLVALQAADNRH